MPKWTEEQQLAIDKEGTNIIVSAGAGSGKTAVLTARTIRKLKSGVDIDKLLILTFTKAAAFEMMIRIRDSIKEIPELKEQLNKIDSAYITTFDSFALSIVKKYHYVLNISKNVKIVDQTIIDLEKRKILDQIFNEYYSNQNKEFLNFIDNFTLKDDTEIKEMFLNINNKLDLKYDKSTYLINYINNYYKTNYIEELVNEFQEYILNLIINIKKKIEDISLELDFDDYQKLVVPLNDLLNSKNYNEIITNLEVKLPIIRGLSEETKKIKEEISNTIKKIKEICIYKSIEDIKTMYNDTISYTKVIIDIILKLDEEINKYKFNNDCYEFVDISKMAISLVKNNQEIKDELKNTFNEIMIDEYQDTSDLQELFMNEIENNNVYMVGDIKQSIYRFRNANPYIFKNKYDNYSNNIGGFKIDLNKNFRSREEVLNNINLIFEKIMDDKIGGADYKKQHQMIFGNNMYKENRKDSQNSNFEIYNYQIPKESKYTKEEIEAFTILKDIKEKVESNYQVIDKKTSQLRNIEYKDFAILIDRSSNFDLYKKIFEYHNIPLSVYKDTNITDEIDIYLINNILNIIKKVKYKMYDKEFIRYFISISRSYLMNYDDKYIFKIIKNNEYETTTLIKKIKKIVDRYEEYDGKTILNDIINEFEFYKNQLLIGNIEQMMARISYIEDLFNNMNELGNSIEEIIDNFSLIIEKQYDIKCSLNEIQEEAVKIMTIHKSKGLEFPICYFAGFTNKFNISDIKEKIVFDNEYGFILPFYNGQELTNINKILMKNKYIKEEVSEKIRLLYVALTRAKEKMIIITKNEDEEYQEVHDVVPLDLKEKYLSFLDIFKSIWKNIYTYVNEININELNLTKDYNNIKKINFKENIDKTKELIKFDELDLTLEYLEESSFSKKINNIITKEENDLLEMGKYFHYLFEIVDFKNPILNNIDDFYKKKIESFLNLDILKDINNKKIYKEYEFIYQDEEMKHGIIDLMIEDENKIDIIDYKLKHITDPNYIKQLEGYKKYIELKTNKQVNIYLYSILEEKLEKLN